MEVFVLLCLVCAVSLHVTFVSSQAQNNVHYWRCKKGSGIFQCNSKMTMTSSRLGCFEACSADDTCRSVNMCPSSQTTGQWDCELLDSYSPWFCRRLDTATNPQCFHSEKSSHCQNGGRLRNDGTCKCEPCFMGDDCTQHARDCMEAKEVLAKDRGGYDSGAVCLIQPKSALKSFRVRCNFETGTTSLIWRTHNSLGSSPVDWKSYTWNNYKQGMESFDTNNFFVGLENMRLFLAQAEYRVTLWNVYHAPKPQIKKSPSFKTIRLGDETDKFALQYDLYSGGAESSSTAPNTYESFKGRGVPHPFCTEDSDCGTCAKDKGPGWYYVEGNGVCVGTSPFAPIPQWPQDEGLLTLETTAYPMERIGDFY